MKNQFWKTQAEIYFWKTIETWENPTEKEGWSHLFFLYFKILWCWHYLLFILTSIWKLHTPKPGQYQLFPFCMFWCKNYYSYFFYFFFCSLPYEYFDPIKGQLSDSYSVIGQVWMLFIVTIQPWSICLQSGSVHLFFPHLKSLVFSSRRYYQILHSMIFKQEIKKIVIKIVFWWCLKRYYLMILSRCYYKSSNWCHDVKWPCKGYFDNLAWESLFLALFHLVKRFRLEWIYFMCVPCHREVVLKGCTS